MEELGGLVMQADGEAELAGVDQFQQPPGG
jgi:hypothetical protein